MLYVTGRWSGYLACNQSILPSGYKVISEVARNRIPIVQPADSPCFETMILKILSYFVEIFPRKLNFCKKKTLRPVTKIHRFLERASTVRLRRSVLCVCKNNNWTGWKSANIRRSLLLTKQARFQVSKLLFRKALNH